MVKKHYLNYLKPSIKNLILIIRNHVLSIFQKSRLSVSYPVHVKENVRFLLSATIPISPTKSLCRNLASGKFDSILNIIFKLTRA